MARPLPPGDLYPAGVPSVRSRYLTLASGVRVRVAESGDANAPAVVMLHGWGGSLFMFRHGLALLPERGLRAIAVDLRGHGLSDHPRARGAYSLDAYIGDIDALLDALALPSAMLIGQSMGGAIALRYAMRRATRVGRLALINPAGLVPVPWLRTLRSAPRAPIALAGARLIPRWLVGIILRRVAFFDASGLTERDVDQYWTPTQLPGYVNALMGSIDEFVWQPLLPAEAASVPVPSVVIIGENDRLLRESTRPAQALARARVHCLSGGHCVHEERPAEVFQIIGDFLADDR